MDLQGFMNIIKGIKSAYPQFNVVDTKEGIQMWHAILKDIPDKVLTMAVHNHIATEHYPPSIAQIRTKALEIMTPQQEQNLNGWGLVEKAIRIYGYYRATEALEYIDQHDKTAGVITRQFGFQNLCVSETQMADRAHFLKLYEPAKEKETKYNSLPTALKQAQQQLSQNRYDELQNLKQQKLGS